MLRQSALARGATLALGWECEAVAQDASSATVTVVERSSGRRQTLMADYVVGCDGAQSIVGAAAGITRSGLGAHLLLHFHAPQQLRDPKIAPAAFYAIFNPGGGGLVVPTRNEHWCVHGPGFPADIDVSTMDVGAVIANIVGPSIDFAVTDVGSYFSARLQ